MNVVCSICIESILTSTAIGLDCGHVYHQSCIKDWVKMKSNCPMCKVTVRKNKLGKVVYFSTNETEPNETGPADPRLLAENTSLKSRIINLTDSVAAKDRTIKEMTEKQMQQNTTLQYLKQLKRQVYQAIYFFVADMDDDLAKPTSKALFDSMKALPRDELICSLASLRSKLKYNKRETDKIAYQLQKSNKIIEELAQDNSQKEKELRLYQSKYPEENTENTENTENGEGDGTKRLKKRKFAHLGNNLFSRASSSNSFYNTSKLATIDLGDDDDDDDDSPQPYTISEHRRAADSSSMRHFLPGCHYCRGVPSLPDHIEISRQGKKCMGCDRRLLYPNESSGNGIMEGTSNATIDVDAESSSRNQSVCIILSDDEQDDDSTSDEL
ncbi:hypothetical protein K501DRAFT_329520 [Backusella circina FSU 941]|nr:hypothetical protein K501DRAFT_329520 [Backusella circina FSU 941]